MKRNATFSTVKRNISKIGSITKTPAQLASDRCFVIVLRIGQFSAGIEASSADVDPLMVAESPIVADGSLCAAM